MTTASEHASPALTDAESRADQIQYLSPTPAGFNPEYDYLALIKSARSATVPGAPLSRVPYNYTECEQQSAVRAHFVNSSGLIEPVWPKGEDGKSKMEWIHENLKSLREQFRGEGQEGARILVVEDFDWTFLQALGAAIDLDPTFLWRHYHEELDSEHYVEGMAALRNKFFTLVSDVRNQRVAATDVVQQRSNSPMNEDRGIHLRHHSPFTALGYSLSSHISCYRITTNSCECPFLVVFIISKCKC